MLLKLNGLGYKFNLSIHGIVLFSVLCQGIGAFAAPNQLRQQKSVSSSPDQTATIATLKVQQTVKVKRENLNVQLTQCVRAEKGVICTLLLSSLKEKVAVWITDPNRRRSRLIDGEGSEYSSFRILQFGKSEADLLFLDKTPVKLVLSFDELPAQLSSISLLEIGLETYGHEIPIQFHRVNVSNVPTIAEHVEQSTASDMQRVGDRP